MATIKSLLSNPWPFCNYMRTPHCAPDRPSTRFLLLGSDFARRATSVSGILLALLLLSLGILNSRAASRTWLGAGANSFWDTAANWQPAGAADNGDSLIFPVTNAKLQNTNRFLVNGANRFSFIRFQGGGYSLQTTTLSLTNGLTNMPPLGAANTLNGFVQLRKNQGWFVTNKTILTLQSNLFLNGFTLNADVDGVLSFDGNVVGSGELAKSGVGRLELNGLTNSPTTTRVLDGTLQVDGALTGSLIISNGAALSGTGIIPTFTCAGDLKPGGDGVGALTVSGAVSSVFTPGSRLFIHVAGNQPGVGYDQLRMISPPSLSGASLILTRDPAVPIQLGQSFIILTNSGAGAISTSFINLPAGARITNNANGRIVFEIRYNGGNGNDVELRVVEGPVLPTGVVRTWDGGGSQLRFWKNSLNWDNNTPPAQGDALVFPESAPIDSRRKNTNDLASGTILDRIALTLTNATWQLDGNGVGLLSGLSAQSSIPGLPGVFTTTLGLEFLQLQADESFTASNVTLTINSQLRLNGHTLRLAAAAGARLVATGSSEESGQILIDGPGVTQFTPSSQMRFVGDVVIKQGTVIASGALTNSGLWALQAGTMQSLNASFPTLLLQSGELYISPNSLTRVEGNLNGTPQSRIRLEPTTFDGSTALINVSGKLNLGSAQLLLPVDLFPFTGRTTLLIRNDGPSPVVGTFANLPEGGLLRTTNDLGIVALGRISYLGGDGNDVILTVIPPPPSGVTRQWTGLALDFDWTQPGNWLNDLAPQTGDALVFPVVSANPTNINSALTIADRIEWQGSNYVTLEGLYLLNGFSATHAAGTNTIRAQNVGLLSPAEQFLNVQHTDAVVRIDPTLPPGIGEEEFSPSEQAGTAQPGLAGVIKGNAIFTSAGPFTKSGEGTLILANMPMEWGSNFNINEGVVRLENVLTQSGSIQLNNGRLEVLNAGVSALLGVAGEIDIQRQTNRFESFPKGLKATRTKLQQGTSLTVDFSVNGAPDWVALDSESITLAGVTLNVKFPATPALGDVFHVTESRLNQTSGIFDNYPDQATLDIDGYRYQIRYNQTLNAFSGRTLTTFRVIQVPSVAPRFTEIKPVKTGLLALTGTATPSRLLTIEQSPDLIHWIAIGNASVSPAGTFSFVVSTVEPQLFFRAIEQGLTE